MVSAWRWMGVGIVLMAGAVVAQQQAGGIGAARPPLVQWVGHESKHMAGFVMARDEAAWRKVWAAHTGADGEGAMRRHAAPKIDFERCMVVGRFAGARTNHDGEEAVSVEDRGDAVVVRFMASTFQTSGPDGGGVATTPFGLWVVPAAKKPVVIEEGRMGLKGSAVRWEEVARLPG
ncbi:MAG: hypothetical protein ACKVW3_17945 [Phycisphaerales bacterium]